MYIQCRKAVTYRLVLQSLLLLHKPVNHVTKLEIAVANLDTFFVDLIIIIIIET